MSEEVNVHAGVTWVGVFVAVFLALCSADCLRAEPQMGCNQEHATRKENP